MALATVASKPASGHTFWRDERLPFIEARRVEDGRKVCYARHAHDFFSIGAITAGQSIYINGTAREHTSTGTVVLINPEDVHACNPIDDQPWSYIMLYVDMYWLADIQYQLAPTHRRTFRPFPVHSTTDPDVYAGLYRLSTILMDEQVDTLVKASAAHAFFSDVQLKLGGDATCPGRDAESEIDEGGRLYSG